MAIDHHQLEEGQELHLDFKKLTKVAQTDHPVIPVAVQDVDSKAVLLIGYVNELALQYTLENRVATFWSTSRNELWIKGATSGDVLELIDVRVNCEQNSLLYIVRLKGGGSCHTKENDQSRYGCYYRSIQNSTLTFTDPKTIFENCR
ncbi:MAG: phosphoribosyl-AMP cyclohydrolase [Candidatus Latescibacterota bacterium]